MKGQLMPDYAKVQWTMTVTIFHGPDYGHEIELVTETRGRPLHSTHDVIGRWRGTGVPEEVVKGAHAMISAALWEHLVTRYGVRQTLEGWGDVPDPF